MTTKPSQWALDLYSHANIAWDVANGRGEKAYEAAALVIEQAFEKRDAGKLEDAMKSARIVMEEMDRIGKARFVENVFERARKEWESELCDWLRSGAVYGAHVGPPTGALFRSLSEAIARGDYRKEGT